MEVDVIADKSSPVFPQKKMVLNDDEEQHDCSVFPCNIEHDLIPTGKVNRDHALLFGTVLSIISVVGLYYFSNLTSAILLSIGSAKNSSSLYS